METMKKQYSITASTTTLSNVAWNPKREKEEEENGPIHTAEENWVNNFHQKFDWKTAIKGLWKCV